MMYVELEIEIVCMHKDDISKTFQELPLIILSNKKKQKTKKENEIKRHPSFSSRKIPNLE